MNPNVDPIAFVLDMMWSDLTARGHDEAMIQLRASVACRDYPAALALAIAIEVDRAKREETERQHFSGRDRLEKVVGSLERVAFVARKTVNAAKFEERRIRRAERKAVKKEDAA